jgi:predicted phosphodiesterase
MLLAVFADAHAHGDALDAVLTSAVECGAEQLWSLGDMLGGGPDPERTLAATRELCAVALVGNHDYGAIGSVEPARLGPVAGASIELARERLRDDDFAWLRTRKPAARRGDVGCWHGSPRNPVWEFVGPNNVGACLAVQRSSLGLVGHTHVPGAWQATPGGAARRVEVVMDVAIDISRGKWLLNPGAVGAPNPSELGWWDGLDAQAAEGAPWLLLDLGAATATWHRAPFDPAPARRRAEALGLVVAASATRR